MGINVDKWLYEVIKWDYIESSSITVTSLRGKFKFKYSLTTVKNSSGVQTITKIENKNYNK
jgi:hypothetical protein